MRNRRCRAPSSSAALLESGSRYGNSGRSDLKVMRNAPAATPFSSFSSFDLATLSAVIFHLASTYGFAHASTSDENAYPWFLSHLTSALGESASSTAAANPATIFSSSTRTSATSAFPAAIGALPAQPHPTPPRGRGTFLISGSVSFWRNGKAPLPDSLSSGWLGDGTRKPKSSASLLNDACRMKCSVFVAGSQRRMTV